jgi:hypothetical protein
MDNNSISSLLPVYIYLFILKKSRSAAISFKEEENVEFYIVVIT